MSLPDFPPRFDTDIVRPFWEALQRGRLQLPACSECGAWQWYPYEFIRCHPQGTLAWHDVSSTGTVFAFTTVARNFLPNSTAAPYVSALVELDGVPGPRIATVLDLGEIKPQIGMHVRLKPTARSGYTAPVFEPA